MDNNGEFGESFEEVPVTGNKRSGSQRPNQSGLPPKPKKKFAKRAKVWKYFDVQEHDPSRCLCKFCGADIGCDSKTSGTSPMKTHIEMCKMFKDFEDVPTQNHLSSDEGGNMNVAVKCDQSVFRGSVNEMVVVNELSFSFVESEGWKRFCCNVLPQFQTFSRKTCSKDIVAMYEVKKQALKDVFKMEKQRVSLTTDIWVSPITSYNYMVVTAHWIDTNWELQKRIISLKVITDHKGETISGMLIACLEEWSIERVFTVTVDNARANDRAVSLFSEYMLMVGPDSLVLGGEYIHMRCCAHILNLVVSDGLKKSNTSIVAIRNALKYVRSSFTRLMSFEMRCETGKISRGSLPLDVKTRWNSTYLMLSSALKVRVAFEKMRLEDKFYCDYFLEDDETSRTKRVGPPTATDWDEVEVLVKFLKLFYKSTFTFSASKSVSSTVCYNEIVNIEKNLIHKCGNKDKAVSEQAHVMRDKFEKYWDGLMNMNPLVIIGSVFDPRNKMQFASLCFEQLYGKDTIECRQLNSSVLSVLKKLYEEYSLRFKKPEEGQSSSGDSRTVRSESVIFDDDDDDDDDDNICMQSIYDKINSIRRSEDVWSELDIYLAEKTELRVENSLGLSYDVLSWWRCNKSKFPILSELARDILAIQMSSVASESAFSTTGRVLDPYRSSLTPYMVECLLCLQQWLRCNFKNEVEVANLAQMMEEAEFFDSLDSRNSAT